MPGLLRRVPFSWAVGLALFAGRGRGRVSVATTVSVLGIGVGVATLTAVLAVTGGFEEAFRERILGVYPHLVVVARGERFSDYAEVTSRISRMPGVIGANPSTYDEMMISADEGTAGVLVKGVDLEGVDRVSGLAALTRSGSLASLRWREGEPLGVALGCGLLERLRLTPGDRVTLTSPIRGIEGRAAGPLGMAPIQGTFVVRDCFDTGFHEYDSRLVVMDLRSAQVFLDRGPAVRWVEVRLADLDHTEAAGRAILADLEPFTLPDLLREVSRLRADAARVAGRLHAASLPEFVRAAGALHKALLYGDYGSGQPRRFRVIDWKQMNRNLFSALRMQKVVLALFFLIIVVVAAFNIVGTQVVVARERIKEVSTLVALGASRRQLYRVFVAHGMTLGTAGVAVGLGLGLLVVRLIRGLDYALDPAVYHIPKLPAVVHPSDAVVIAALSLAVVFASCLLSSLRAMRLDPVEGLRKIA